MYERPHGRPRHPDILTPAEWRVLAHIRAGRTNAEIAASLGLSINTIRTHVSAMLGKLGLRNRHGLADWPGSPREASRRHLDPSLLSLTRPRDHSRHSAMWESERS